MESGFLQGDVGVRGEADSSRCDYEGMGAVQQPMPRTPVVRVKVNNGGMAIDHGVICQVHQTTSGLRNAIGWFGWFDKCDEQSTV